MPTFPILNLDTAPSASTKLLLQTQNNFGFIPNLIGVMASSPSLTEAYLTTADIFSKSSLSTTEQQIVLLTVSHYHECCYCMAAHTSISAMQNVDHDLVQAIRTNKPIADVKLQALREFTHLLIHNRGWITENDLSDFLQAGYEKSHALDVLVGIAQKTLSNFTNHMLKLH